MTSVWSEAADLLDPPAPEEVELSPEAAEIAETLTGFVRHAWHVLEPGTTYVHNWHIDLIAEHLELFYARDVRRIIFNVPPRFMKSTIVTIMGPVWDWIYRPSDRFMFGSYAQNLSYKHSTDRRTLIRSPWFQGHYGHLFRLSGDQDEKREFANDRRGHMIATSMLGQATGKGGDFIVIDDPQDPQKARSDTMRTRINTIFDQTFTNRLDDPKTGGIAVVMQRLHTRDLTGHVLAKQAENDDGHEWVHVKVPAEAPRATTVVKPKSKEIIEIDAGEVLWPERLGEAELAVKKVELGSLGYAGQYQQEPTDEEGAIFNRKWWGFWKPAGSELPVVRVQLPDGTDVERVAVDLPALSTQIQSWDCTFKDTKGTDFVVGGVIGTHGADRFLIDRVRDRMSFTATLAAIKALTARHPRATAKLVEDKANGPAVIDTLKHQVPGLIAVNPEGGKEARAWAVQPLVEASNVYLPHPAIAPWVWDFIEELAGFPNAAHDDQVDMLTQGLLRLMTVKRTKVSSARGQQLPSAPKRY